VQGQGNKERFMSDGNYAVIVENLTRQFGTFTAVDRVTFSVRQGEIFGFLGANGAGKTTTIRMLCGLLRPSSGSATVAGFDVYKEYEKIKQNIGYMAQRFSLYEDLTVKENIEFFGGIYGLNRKQIAAKTAELLDYLNLWDKADQLTASLPLGWKQRMALSSAILHDPDLIFLDEPTSGVDPESRRNFWMLIYELSARGKTVFVTTHFMDEAEYCHRVSIMRDGKIVELDRPQLLKQKYAAQSMQDVFMKVVNGAQS
jgi:ABC-2 type transport system ATP-binding protein